MPLQSRLENMAIGTPKDAFHKNVAIVLFVAACFKRSYRLNKIIYFFEKWPIVVF